MKRRHFLQNLAAGAFAGGFLPALRAQTPSRKARIVLRSSWQTVNIGDIGHTPGVLRLLEEGLPEAEIRLWPSNVGNGVAEMLQRRFPKVALVQGAEGVRAAFEECDFLLHGSGPAMVAQNDVAKWRNQTGKPYGIFGITLGAADPALVELISNARFAYFRDSVSLAFAKNAGIASPIMGFSPDGAFAVDLRDEEKAVAFLKANGLEEGKFLCVIPRLRNTPYWRIPSKKAVFNAEKDARNEALKEHDPAQLREAIIAVVRETEMKVLICPEDETQMAIGKEMLFDPLPADVKAKVVWREKYWLTDEALSTYVRSAGLFGNEMHSPIMCIGNGIPAIVCRWKEQTSKGFMWRDIGLGDWLFDLDQEEDLPKIVPAVLAMAKDPAAAKVKALQARERVRARFRETVAVLGGELQKIVARPA